MSRCLFGLAFVLCLAGMLRADEVKTKDGKVYKNLTLKQETATQYTFVDLDDKKIVLAKSAVESYEKKPTVRDEFNDRRKAANSTDAKALIELAKWAKGEGLGKEARALYGEIVKADPENAEAQAALGNVKKDGKWIPAAEAEAARQKEMAPRFKALNFVQQKDGTWIAPAEASIKKLGLVQHEGWWVTKELKKKIEDQGLRNCEGEWLTKEEQAKFDAGQRKYKGAWKETADLDELHQKWDDPWVFKSQHVELHTTLRHKRSSILLKVAEDAVAAAIAMSGIEPDVYGDAGLLVIRLGKSTDEYRAFGAAAKPDWAAFRSSDDGMFYSPLAEKKRGGAFTFFQDEDYVKWWVGRAAAEAYIGRFADITKQDPKLLDAFTSFFSGFYAGPTGMKYRPPYKQACFIWPNAKAETTDAAKLLDGVQRKSPGSIMKAGYFLQFLAQRSPDGMKDAFVQFLAGSMNRDGIKTAILGNMEAPVLEAEFHKFDEKTVSTYQPPDK